MSKARARRGKPRPTEDEVAAALGYPQGTVVFTRPERWPAPGDPFRVLATLTPVHRGWAVRVEPAVPLGGRETGTQRDAA